VGILKRRAKEKLKQKEKRRKDYRLANKLIIPICAKSRAKKARIGEKSIMPVRGRSLRNIFKIGSVISCRIWEKRPGWPGRIQESNIRTKIAYFRIFIILTRKKRMNSMA